jgi:ankyrin repeat protein
MEIWSGLGGNFEADSHERLKQCCLTYMHIDIAGALEIAGSFATANNERAANLRQSANEKFPFLEYATQNVLYHANAAEAGGISQASFLQSFQRSDWVKLNNLFEHHGVRRHTKNARPLSLSERTHFNLSERHWVRRNTANASLLYILSERDMAALIEALPSNRSFFEEEDERYGAPLFAAFATGSHGAVESFAQLCSKMHPQSSLHRECYNQFLKNRKKSLKLEPTFTFSRKEGTLSHIVAHQEDTLFAFFILLGRAYTDDLRGQALSYAAKRGHEVIVRLLLEAGHVDLNSKCSDDRTPLSWAAGLGYDGIVQLLLETDQVKVDSQCRYGWTPLSWAAQQGHVGIVRLLLQTGKADVNSKCRDGRTPLLFWDAKEEHEAILWLLLQTGKVDVNSKCNRSWTPLSWAAKQGNEVLVRLFLQTSEIDVDLKSNEGQTPLSWAAEGGHEAIVQLLLQSGLVDVNSKSRSGYTPLSLAGQGGHEAVIRLLLQTGQVDVELKDESFGYTPLHWAARGGHEAALRLLVETGKADVNAKCIDGRTPLWWAASTGDGAVPVVRLLLQTGQVADVALEDRLGLTPLWAAMKSRNQAVVRLLRAHGA